MLPLFALFCYIFVYYISLFFFVLYVFSYILFFSLFCSMCFFYFLFFFFFFKQNKAYEMRISDWSSDVCSSDLSPTSVIYSFSGLEIIGCKVKVGVGTPVGKSVESLEPMLGVQQHQFSNFFMPRILINQHIKGHPRPYFIPEGTSWPPPGPIQNEICVIPLAVKLSAHADEVMSVLGAFVDPYKTSSEYRTDYRQGFITIFFLPVAECAHIAGEPEAAFGEIGLGIIPPDQW